MRCTLCKVNDATNHGTSVIEGKMMVEDLCRACFAAKYPEMNATLKRPWICDYCGCEASSYEPPLDMIMANRYPIKQEFICSCCNTAINDNIESAIAVIKAEAKGEEATNQMVLKAVEVAYQFARQGRIGNGG